MDRTVDKIAGYVASFRPRDLTPAALHAVKRALIDSVGCALGAYSAEPVEITRRIATRYSSTVPATLLGTSIKTTPEMAALVNGFMVRYLDFSDDYINLDGPHPSDNISAVLAAAESVHADGLRLACGITLAYELVCQLVDSTSFRYRGWDYITETSIGSAMGAANILGLSEEQTRHALGLAIAPNIGLRRSRMGELSMWKAGAGPNGGRNGLFAAILAAEGMTGPNEVIEGAGGLWTQVTGEFKLGAFGGKKHPFKIERTFFKPVPVMYTVLLPLETVFKLRDKVNIDNVKSIKVFLDRFHVTSCNFKERWTPHTRETADHSIPYLVVAALVDGEINEKTFTPERYEDPKILGLLSNLTMEEDPEYTRQFPAEFHCRIEVTDSSGRKVVKHGKNPKGHPANPMSDSEIEEKFVKITRTLLTPGQVRKALDQMWHLEEINDVGALLDAVAVKKRQH
ncbi:MAG: MmgE/PrpD family protein [Dehalococcoidales bacterium]|nr:MmgE/PrpD family protein [Dehalococcoidales bacterium]